MVRFLAVLLALAVSLTPSAAPASGGKGAVWERHVVPVHNSLADWWQPYVAAQVDSLNAISPKRGPRFVLHDHEQQDCAAVNSREGYGINLCRWPTEAAFASGLTLAARKQGVVARVEVRIPDWAAAWPEQTLCHELQHAAWWTNDNYGAHPDTSCVQGWLLAPGPWDARFARKLYRRPRDD